MSDLTPCTLVLVAIFLLVAFPVHEFAHAWAAYLLGDATAKLFGRLTLNPIVHFDPLGGLSLIVASLCRAGFLFGWAKPTPVNPSNLRDRRNGEVDRLAGRARCRTCHGGARRVRASGSLDSRAILSTCRDRRLRHSTTSCAFNVAARDLQPDPVPPLDGSALLFRFLPPRQAWQLRPILAQYGFILLLAFVFADRPATSRRSRSSMSPTSWWAPKARQFRTHLARGERRGAARPGRLARRPAELGSSTRCTSPTGATASTSSRACARRASRDRTSSSRGCSMTARKGDTGVCRASRGRWARRTGRGSGASPGACPGWDAALDAARATMPRRRRMLAGSRRAARRSRSTCPPPGRAARPGVTATASTPRTRRTDGSMPARGRVARRSPSGRAAGPMRRPS